MTLARKLLITSAADSCVSTMSPRTYLCQENGARQQRHKRQVGAGCLNLKLDLVLKEPFVLHESMVEDEVVAQPGGDEIQEICARSHYEQQRGELPHRVVTGQPFWVHRVEREVIANIQHDIHCATLTFSSIEDIAHRLCLQKHRSTLALQKVL